MADDRPLTLSVLAKFHREMVVPDIARIVAASEQRLRNEFSPHFDAIYQRFDRLESE